MFKYSLLHFGFLINTFCKFEIGFKHIYSTMNPIAKTFPVFDNIFEAMSFISYLEKNALKTSYIMPLFMDGIDPFVAGGIGLDKDSFIVTRLMCNPDDVDYFRMLSVDDNMPYLTDFKRFSLKPNLAHSNFLFRGQKEDYKSIKANLFRDKNKRYFLDDMIKINELTAFMAMHPIVQLLGIKGFELCGHPMKLQANLYGLAQHYYNKTTEVDFSSSLDVAAFFAVTEYDKATDRYLPIENDSESTGVLYVLPISKSLTQNIIYGYKITSIGKQFCFERPARQLGFLVDCSGNKDLIDHPLLLRVEFRHNKEITHKIYNAWNCGEAISPSDPLEYYWMKYRETTNMPFCISNKAIELNLYRNPKETMDSLINKILTYKDENGNLVFKITGKVWPEFPREILERYWADIKNGWWEDVFCDNVYFPMSGSKMISAFRELPKDSRYRSAFYEK